ncbi:membrane protein of unknown function [Bradyrhizobium vignae]|uniref:Cytochrome oxidase subunit I profile domain-containing protein n=1 Tax=Bradyrhizobium vignae TaxID=1549949 RepID=A0A2U3Q6V0_9BRAD|nr:membrane protein of unknown function [Bradyrhizobium vignae]
MTDAALAGELPFPPRPDYLRAGSTLLSWLASTDHKRIAILYALTITVFFFMGGAAITAVRVELFVPNGWFLTSDTYNRLFSFHGIIMVWFFLVPSIPNTFGNFLLPLMIGAPDVAFPRLNLFSWYLTLVGGIFAVYTLVAGGVDTGWTFYTPFSTMFSNTHVLTAAAAVFVVGFASIATGVNFIATTHMLRAPGMTWFRLPMFVWSIYATSIVMVLSTPVLAISLMLVIAERWLGLPIFDPVRGGILSCSSTCSGSTPIPQYTSWCCRPWAWFRRSFLVSPGVGCSATTSWSMLSSRSPASAFSSGDTICSCPDSRPTLV